MGLSGAPLLPLAVALALGIGIALAIVGRIAEAHGGRTWIEEAPGGGARIGVFWPSPR